MQTISNHTRKAKKKHSCDASHFIHEHKNECMSVDYENDGYKCKGINPGDIYESQFNKDGGDTWQFKACLPCLKYVAENDIDMSGDR